MSTPDYHLHSNRALVLLRKLPHPRTTLIYMFSILATLMKISDEAILLCCGSPRVVK